MQHIPAIRTETVRNSRAVAVRRFRKLHSTSRGSFSPLASNLSGKWPQLLLWAGSRTARELKSAITATYNAQIPVLFLYHIHFGGRTSVVGAATRYVLDGPGFRLC